MQTILFIRLSAMGDVAMSVPVVRALSKQYPHLKILFLTRKTFNPFFRDIPNLILINPDLKNEHKGIGGLFKLYKQIKLQYNPEVILDIHDVLRSKILRFFFKLSFTKVFVIDKGRKEKKALTRRKNKIRTVLKHSTLRYAEVAEKAGFLLKLDKNHVFKHKLRPELSNVLSNDKKNIGIAPFAMHQQKQYPIEKTQQVIALLIKNGYRVLLFGGGKQEQEFADNLSKKDKDIVSLIGKFSLDEEIDLISNLDLMISMDSSNMHIAALTGIHIVSIWGGTHPFAGFTPFIANEKSHIVQRNDLACRPCSVFGSTDCYKEHLECFDIEPAQIVEQCKLVLENP
ncbi:MAG: glycosyltransferase family 9 protein [Bacteroidales bacterium]|nr:glycosyltransferase family 9 protein [Bacteroidales bacterium]